MYIRKETQKRQLTFDQKLSAVNEVRLKSRHRKDVADELGIHINSLDRWVKLYREHGEEALHSHNENLNLIENAEELKRLREIEKKYNEQLTQIEILKKFQAFLKENEQKNVMKP